MFLGLRERIGLRKLRSLGYTGNTFPLESLHPNGILLEDEPTIQKQIHELLGCVHGA